MMICEINPRAKVIAPILTLLLLFGVASAGTLRGPNPRTLQSIVSILESSSNDRSNPVPFPSKSEYDVTDNVYVYVAEHSDIQKVVFFIDGAEHKIENIAPWDLEGGWGNADPFSMSFVGGGTHTLRADVTKFSGGVESVEVTFHVKADIIHADTFDLRQFLYSEIESGNKYIVVPPGVYRVTPQWAHHLQFSNVHDVTIMAEGVEMICTETTRAISISGCSNFKIKGLTVDYDPLPYTQGKITGLSADKTVHQIELFEGYPPAEQITGGKYEIFRSDTRQLRYGSYYGTSVRVIDSKHIEVTRRGDYKGEQVGDIIAINTNYVTAWSNPHAFELKDSTGITLEDVTLYSGNMFGFLEIGCSGNHYLRCSVDRRPAETDYITRADPRIRSNNADAFHSKHAEIGPKIEDCTARFMGDDAVAINGDYDMVMRSVGTTLYVLGKNNKISVRDGDPLEVVSYYGERLPDAKVISVTQSNVGATQEDIDFMDAQWMHAEYKNNMRTVWLVEIDRAIDLPQGSLIAPANRLGNHFNVTGGNFGYNRSRGILVKGSHGVISNNKIEGSVMQAIKVAPEFWWLEAGSSNNVQIVGNYIEHCGGVGIEVSATAGAGGTAPAGAHNDITISNNIICDVAQEPIKVTSTRRLVLSNNSMDMEPSFEKCEDVTM